jgi:hypothetical protein
MNSIARKLVLEIMNRFQLAGYELTNAARDLYGFFVPAR